MENGQVMKETVDFLSAKNDFLLLTHVQPDGDALGSMLGIAHLLKAIGKKFIIASEEPIAEKFRFLPMSDEIQLLSEISDKFSNLITLDCGDFKRFGDCEKLIAQNVSILNIDHHKTNDLFGQVNLIDIKAAATSQIVYEIAKFMSVDITKEMAICLYTGILTDTGGFRYSNTTVEVHQIAAKLLGMGVSPYDIAERVLETLTWQQAQLIREALGTLHRDPSGKLSWVVLKRSVLDQYGASDEDAEGLVNYARNIQGVEVGILFKEKMDGSIKVSFRSKFKVDVGEIALSFGGGGHARAAGCTLPGPIEKVESDVLTKVREYLSV